jgi:hypothetical protein
MVAPIAAVAGKAAVGAALEKHGGKLLVVLLAVLLIVPVTIVVIPAALVLFAVTSLHGSSLFCDPAFRTPSVDAVSWTPDNLTAAQASEVQIVTAAARQAGAGDPGVLAALTAAFLATQVTALQPLNTTDDTPVGVYARTVRGGWGTTTDLQNTAVTTVRILVGNGDGRPGVMSDSNWQTQPPASWMTTIGMGSVPATEIADATAKAKAILAGDGITVMGLDAGCGVGGAVSADQVMLAQDLMIAANEGRLYGHDLQQIRDLALGISSADCGIDVRILQVLTIAVQNFGRVGFSDINRRCSGVNAGAGATSAHYANGGGHAIDIFALDGTIDGGASETQSATLLAILDPLMPNGARAGQGECGWQNTIRTINIIPFYGDSCDHLHIDVGFTDEPLRVSAP